MWWGGETPWQSTPLRSCSNAPSTPAELTAGRGVGGGWGASCRDLQQGEAHFHTLARPASPTDLDASVNHTSDRGRLRLVIQSAFYPDMIHTPRWRHASVGGFRPVPTDAQVCKIRDLEAEKGILFDFFFSPQL